MSLTCVEMPYCSQFVCAGMQRSAQMMGQGVHNSLDTRLTELVNTTSLTIYEHFAQVRMHIHVEQDNPVYGLPRDERSVGRFS
jgi:hypothetical protein